MPKTPQVKKENFLRYDADFMSDDDIQNWVDNVLENTNYQDIKTIRDKLSLAIEKHDLEVVYSKGTKFCDTCSISYPYHITWCKKCNNDRLREFYPTRNIEAGEGDKAKANK